MKVFVTGTRGIPDIPGGVEQHCEQLYPLLAKLGVEVILARRTPYVVEKLDTWNGIKLVDLFAPRNKYLEAIIHTGLALFQAKRCKTDIVHIHAIGPALMAPVARLLGLKVVITNHGPDYDRQKWGHWAKAILRLGEYLGCKFAHEVISISLPIKEIVQRRCHRNSHLIYNGTPIPDISTRSDFLHALGLQTGTYILSVARLVPEKGLHDLIGAFEEMQTGLKLVIAGGSDHAGSYSAKLKTRACRNKNILMSGYVRGNQLEQLYTHARLFVLPSYHEGLPVALLEALSFGLPVIVSNIPANIAVGLEQSCYFDVGDPESLTRAIENSLSANQSKLECETRKRWVGERYNWDTAAKQTSSVYRHMLNS